MKKEILKIAGVKSEKEFYKKYPTEEAFKKAFPKEYKKAAMGAAMVQKQLTQLTDYANPPKAQDSRVIRAANANLNFWEKCGLASSADNGGGGRFGGGSDKPSKYKNPYEEISDIKAYEKDERKAFEKSLPKGVDLADWVALNRDASRMNALLRNPEYDKYTDEEGVLKPEYQSVATRFDPYYLYYKPAFVGKKDVTAEDILKYHQSQPGGLAGYRELVNRRYKPEQQQYGGSTQQSDIGSYMGGEQSSYKPMNYTELYDQADYANTGVNRQMKMEQANLAAQQEIAANSAKKGGLDLGSLMGSVGNIAQLAESLEHGGNIHKAQFGDILKQLGLNTASYKGGQIQSPTGQVTRQQTEALGFKSDGSNYGANKFSLGMQNFGKGIGAGYDKLDSSLGKIGGVQGAIGIGKDLLQGFQQLKQEKEQQRSAHQAFELSGLTKQVAELTPDIKRRIYDRAENRVGQTNEIGQTTGIAPGNQFIAANGAMIGGNPTEIQNTYDPGNLYVDLGYEPLNDSDEVKQYQKGGKITTAQFGIDKMAGQAGMFAGSLIGGGKGRPNAGGQIGSTIGSTVGKFIPIPGASAILGGVGGLVGGILGGKSAKKTEAWETGAEQNTQDAAFMSGARGMQAQNAAYMEDGGWISHNWQPQVITTFGEYKLKDLLKPDETMDTLRSGGHIAQLGYTAPSEAAMSTERPDMAMGGNLKTTWGGYAEPISYNPYLPGTGETVLFRGQSHDESDGKGRTGIGVKYGHGAHDSYTDYAEYGTEKADADVEVERNETGVELPDTETGSTSLVVSGNMIAPKYVLAEIGEENNKDFKGKKFKYIDKEYAKQEQKQNKKVEKGIKLINSVNSDDPYSLLTLMSGQAMVYGGNKSLQTIADKRIGLSGGQNAILQTSKEMGVKSDALAKGKIEKDKDSNMAKFGKEIKKAQPGVDQPKNDYELKPWKGNLYGLGKKTASAYSGEEWENIAREMGFKGKGNLQFQRFLADNPDVMPYILKRHNELYGKDILFDEKLGAAWQGGLDRYRNRVPMQENPIQPIGDIPEKAKEVPDNVKVTPIKKPSTLEILFNEIAPFVRPSNQEKFDYRQINPELAALAMNQLEPVQAQTFQPLLEQPYTVSLQDQLNANQADFNALQRQLGYNPAAAATLAAQKYAANSSILGQQMRINQELAMGAYNRNRGILNDASLKNLAILDQQYQRQSQARSNTKAQAQAAFASIADKMAKHKLENRTLGVYENMYNYRFGPKGRAINLNAPYEFNTEAYASTDNLIPVKNSKGEITEYRVKDKETAKNGSLVKAIKNL